ncbi:MAG: hypothetical protein IJ619_03255 [Eubacterium sp.]|nr:hypothetical protein [Eubacterium sp.]MCR5293053.1 hypothetical protein [Eubacterium sp.]
MKTSVNLQDPYAFMIWWIIIAIVAVIVAVLLHLWIYKKLKPLLRRKDEKKPKIHKPKPEDLITIKRKYVALMNDLERDVMSNRITVRHGYQKMSKTIRGFVHEVTRIRVQEYTLSEINELGIPSLTMLMTEYYEPEFARYTRADIRASIRRTREVISSWY